jgi:hypothetical protein
MAILASYGLFIISGKFNMTKNKIYFFISFIFIANLITSIEYVKLYYPRDCAFNIIKQNNVKSVTSVYEWCGVKNRWPRTADCQILKSKSNIKDSVNVLAVNFNFMYPVNNIKNYRRFIPTVNNIEILRVSHFINYKAYQYEGLTLLERYNIDKTFPEIRAFVIEKQ